MSGPTRISDAKSVEVLEVRADEAGVTLVVRAGRPTVCCPDCGQPAARVHSWYQRTLADLRFVLTVDAHSEMPVPDRLSVRYQGRTRCRSR